MMTKKKSTYDMSIHQNPSAVDWAKFYCETNPDADEATMVGWFANAMMAMHDHLLGQQIQNGDHLQHLHDIDTEQRAAL